MPQDGHHVHSHEEGHEHGHGAVDHGDHIHEVHSSAQTLFKEVKGEGMKGKGDDNCNLVAVVQSCT